MVWCTPCPPFRLGPAFCRYHCSRKSGTAFSKLPDYIDSSAYIHVYFNFYSFTEIFSQCKTNGGGWEHMKSNLSFTLELVEQVVVCWRPAASLFPVYVFMVITVTNASLDARKNIFFYSTWAHLPSNSSAFLLFTAHVQTPLLLFCYPSFCGDMWWVLGLNVAILFNHTCAPNYASCRSVF